MLPPDILSLFNSKTQVRLLLANYKEKLIDIGLYGLLTDWLFNNFSIHFK